MVQTSPDGPAHLRQSQILVPMDAPGVEVLGPMNVFSKDDAPHGHMHLRFADCRVPKDNILLGEGAGSRSPRSASARAVSITACAPSARPRRRSS